MKRTPTFDELSSTKPPKWYIKQYWEDNTIQGELSENGQFDDLPYIRWGWLRLYNGLYLSPKERKWWGLGVDFWISPEPNLPAFYRNQYAAR